MRKALLVLALLLFVAATSYSQHYSGIMKTQDNGLLYSTPSEEWLTESDWVKQYGRKSFNYQFPNKTNYTHAQEREFIRWDIEEAYTHLSNGEVIWSRVFQNNSPIETLTESASLVLENPQINDNKVVGELTNQKFIDYEEGIWTTFNYRWSAKVTYEFRDGRYKVTLSNIKIQSTVTFSTGGYFRVQNENAPVPLSYILYNNGEKRLCYNAFINSIDHTFSNTTFLINLTDANDDW